MHRPKNKEEAQEVEETKRRKHGQNALTKSPVQSQDAKDATKKERVSWHGVKTPSLLGVLGVLAVLSPLSALRGRPRSPGRAGSSHAARGP